MWLSIRFTLLPLESLETQIATTAQVVVENNLVVCANEKAILQGVKPNQSLSTVYALCNEVDILERNLNQEKQRLNNIAILIYAYTPSIAIEGNELLLAEIGNSLKLYGTLEKLLALLTQELEKERLDYQLGLGSTPKTAELTSHYALDKPLPLWITDNLTLAKVQCHKKLSNLPIKLLSISKKTIHKLQSVGINKLAELKALPSHSIRKRFGKDLSEYLLKLSGERPDPKVYFIPKENFHEKLDFLNVVHHREGLFFSIKRLINNLCQFLSIKQKISQTLRWTLFDSEKNSISFNVLVSNNYINVKTYFELTQLNLERHTLYAPIESISLSADRLSELSGKTDELFGQVEGFTEEIDFVKKIQAKLGSNSCHSLQQKEEHLPEFSSTQLVSVINKDTPIPLDNSLSHQESTSQPIWLFDRPKPIKLSSQGLIWRGELKIISHKERIISRWWEQETVKDYFLAEHDNGIVYWIFFERTSKQWFIHGIYS